MAMIRFATEILAGPGRPLTADAPVPFFAVQGINDRWRLRREDNIILDVMLPTRTSEDWVQLGNLLLRLFENAGSHVAVALEGTCPLRILLRWANKFRFDQLQTRLQLKIETVKHPMRHTVVGINAIWLSYVPAPDTSWMRTLWRDTGSKLFDQDCDMIVAYFHDEVLANLDWLEPLTLEQFGRAVDRAVAWIVPVDGNFGYIVGLPSSSNEYRRLTTLARG
jgi:hypothetical protein